LKDTSFNETNPIKVLVHGFNGDLFDYNSLCENVMPGTFN